MELIKLWENCYLDAYPDPKTGNLPITIGWGCTVREDGGRWKLGDRITQDRADKLLFDQLSNYYFPILEKTVPYWNEMPDNKKGALGSFAYNCGEHFMTEGNFDTIAAALRSKDWAKVAEAFLLYCNPKDKHITKGLQRRRRSEKYLWLGMGVKEAYARAIQELS